MKFHIKRDRVHSNTGGTQDSETRDSTGTRVLGLVNNNYVFFFRSVNIEETLKRLMSSM